jgi:hypothetical protein
MRKNRMKQTRFFSLSHDIIERNWISLALTQCTHELASVDLRQWCIRLYKVTSF